MFSVTDRWLVKCSNPKNVNIGKIRVRTLEKRYMPKGDYTGGGILNSSFENKSNQSCNLKFYASTSVDNRVTNIVDFISF